MKNSSGIFFSWLISVMSVVYQPKSEVRKNHLVGIYQRWRYGTMSEKVIIFDTTLRDGEQSPGASMNIKEKLEVAYQLAKLNVDVIEAGFPISSEGDFESVKLVAESVKGPVIAGLARAKEIDIKRCGEAIQNAEKGRIHTFIATSDVHIKKKLKMTREEVLKAAVDSVKYAKTFTDDVEFSAEDAGRSDKGFLIEILSAVIEAGAKTLNIPDTVGYTLPWEFGALIKYLQENVRGVEKTIMSVHCHNDLGLAVANSISAVINGVRQVECTINGIGERAGNASLEEIVMIIKTRKDLLDYHTDIETTQLFNASKLVTMSTGIKPQPNKAIIGANAFAHEAGIHQDGVLKERLTYEIMTAESVGWSGESMVMGKHSGRHAFVERLKELGYTGLSDEEVNKAFVEFKRLADLKKEIYNEDLVAIVEQELSDFQKTYELEYLHITSGTTTIPTVTVRLKTEEGVLSDASNGDGPVDAAFKAIERITGISAVLEDYRLESVSKGKDAIGQALIRVRYENRIYKGRGASTDVIEASVKAYIDAVNKIVSSKGIKKSPDETV